MATTIHKAERVNRRLTKAVSVFAGLILALLLLPVSLTAQQTDPADAQLRDAYRRLRFDRQYPPEAVTYIQSQLQNEERAAKKLAQIAKDERPEVPGLVAMLLGELGETEGAETLWHLIRDDVEYVRVTAAGAVIRLAQFTPVVPAVEGLQDSRPTVRRLIAGTLGRLGDKSAEGALINQLHDEDEMARAEVVNSLGACGTTVAVPSLVEALHDPAVPVRTAAASSLSMFDDPAIAPALAEALKDPDWHVRAAATTALAKVQHGKPAITQPILGKLKSDEFALVRDRAADALDLPNDDAAVNALVDAILSEDRDARYHAAKTLEISKAVSALPKLLAHRDDPNPEARLKIFEVIGAIGGSDEVPALLEATNDSDPNVRLAAIEALRRLREQGAVKVLVQRLNDPSPHVRARAARVLGDLGDHDAVQSLVQLLRDENGFVRGAAAEALGKLGDATAVPSLVQVLTGLKAGSTKGQEEDQGLVIGTAAKELPDILRQKQVEEKVKAVQALGEIGDTQAADPIIEKGLRADDPTLRAESAIALGKMRVQKAVEPLKQTVAPYYQDVPVDTENIIASETAVSDSVRLLREKESRVRASVAWALGQIGDATAVSTLNRALNDPNSLVRDAAVEALAKISEHQEDVVGKATAQRATR